MCLSPLVGTFIRIGNALKSLPEPVLHAHRRRLSSGSSVSNAVVPPERSTSHFRFDTHFSGAVWSSLIVSGHGCLCLILSCSIWLHLIVSGLVWSCLVVSGQVLISTDLTGLLPTETSGDFTSRLPCSFTCSGVHNVNFASTSLGSSHQARTFRSTLAGYCVA